MAKYKGSGWPRTTKLRASESQLLQDLTRSLVREDLALDALQRVVDRLRVAAELLGHLLVGGALEVEPQRVRLQLREPASEGEDETLELLRRDHADGGLVDARAGKRVSEGAVAVGLLTGGGCCERAASAGGGAVVRPRPLVCRA